MWNANMNPCMPLTFAARRRKQRLALSWQHGLAPELHSLSGLRFAYGSGHRHNGLAADAAEPLAP